MIGKNKSGNKFPSDWNTAVAAAQLRQPTFQVKWCQNKTEHSSIPLQQELQAGNTKRPLFGMEHYYAFYLGNLVKFKTLDENVSPCITHHSPGDRFSKRWQRWWRSEHLLKDLAVTLPCPLAKGLPLGGSDSKESACNAGDLSSIPGLGRSQEKEMATYSSIVPWEIPWTEELVGYCSWGSTQR